MLQVIKPIFKSADKSQPQPTFRIRTPTLSEDGRAPIRPLQDHNLPQHLSLPTVPHQILAYHPTLDVLVCRARGFGGVSLYADGWDVTDDALTVAEAAFLCTGPAELVRKTLKEKFNVELAC